MCPCACMCARPNLVRRMSNKTKPAAISPLATRLQKPREKRTPHQQQVRGASAPRSAISGQQEQQCKRFGTLLNIAAGPAAGQHHVAPTARARQRGRHDRHRDLGDASCPAPLGACRKESRRGSAAVATSQGTMQVRVRPGHGRTAQALQQHGHSRAANTTSTDFCAQLRSGCGDCFPGRRCNTTPRGRAGI